MNEKKGNLLWPAFVSDSQESETIPLVHLVLFYFSEGRRASSFHQKIPVWCQRYGKLIDEWKIITITDSVSKLAQSGAAGVSLSN